MLGPPLTSSKNSQPVNVFPSRSRGYPSQSPEVSGTTISSQACFMFRIFPYPNFVIATYESEIRIKAYQLVLNLLEKFGTEGMLLR